jgi:hypothetical protein
LQQGYKTKQKKVLRYFQWGCDSVNPEGLRKLAGGANPELSTQLLGLIVKDDERKGREKRQDG